MHVYGYCPFCDKKLYFTSDKTPLDEEFSARLIDQLSDARSQEEYDQFREYVEASLDFNFTRFIEKYTDDIN